MATTVEKVNVVVSADTAQFNGAIQQSAEFFKGFAGEIASFAAATLSVNALAAIGKRALETAEQVDRMSQSFGVGMQSIQVLSYAAALAGGGGIESMASALGKLEKTATGAVAGNKAAAAGFDALGIKSARLAELIKTPDELLREVTKNLAGMEDGANKTAIAMAVMGRSAADQIPLINALGQDYDELKKRAIEIGVVLSQDQIKALGAVDDKMDDLGQVVDGLGNKMMLGLLPAIKAALNGFDSMLTSDFAQSFFDKVGTGVTQVMALTSRFASDTYDAMKTVYGAWNEYYENVYYIQRGIGKEGSLTFGKLEGDLLDYVQKSMDEWSQISGAAQKAWVLIQEGAAIAFAKIRGYVAAFVEGTAKGLDQVINGVAALGGSWTTQSTIVQQSVKGITASLRENDVSSGTYVKRLNEIDAKTKENIASNKKYVDGIREQANELKKLDSDEDGKPRKKAPGIVDPSAAAEANKAREAYAKLFDIVDKLNEQGLGPYAKTLAELDSALDAIEEATQKAIEAGYSKIKVEQAEKLAVDAAYAAYNRKVEILDKQNDIVQKSLDKLDDERRKIGLNAEQLAAYTAVQEALNAAKEKEIVISPEYQKKIADEATEVYRAQKAWNAYQDSIEETKRIWQGGADAIADATGKLLTGQLKSFKDFKDMMVSTVRDMVGQMIAQYLRLNVLGPILQGILGGGGGGGGGWGGLLGAAVSMGIGSGGSGGQISGGTGAIGTIGAGAGAGGTTDWLGMAQNLYGGYNMLTGQGGGIGSFFGGSNTGVFGGFQNAWGNLQNSYSTFMYGSQFNPNSANFMGPPAAGMNPGAAPGYGGYGSPWGQGLGVAAGIYAGYNRFQNRYDLGSGLAGGAAYGLGTYALGAGAASAMAGTGFAAGMSGAFAIPVVGWIAAIAMLVDMISGGGLFGTDANKFQKGIADLNIGESGASLSIGADYKGKKPLFGGSYHEWKTMQPTAEQIEAANAFYKAILDQSSSFGKQFGLEAGLVASGTFRQEFDKKGNVTATSATINGQKYEGISQEDFGKRMVAESYILDLKKAGVDVTTFTNGFIKDIDAYTNAVQDAATSMLMARRDLKNGIDISGAGTLQGAFDTAQKYNDQGEGLTATYTRLSDIAKNIKQGIDIIAGPDTIAGVEAFLRATQDVGESLSQTYARVAGIAKDLQAGNQLLTGQKTVAEVEAFIRTMQQGGETLAQTYQRLAAAAQQYRQIMGQVNQAFQQLWVGNDPARQFAASIVNLNQQVQSQIDALNAAAKAAGLQGASEADLARVHSVAAAQAAAAMAQLQQAGLGAVDMLWGSGTLDGQIAALQAKANNASRAVGGFGDAMNTAAQRASEAMNLLLGDLSPLNDLEKLNKAMEGLRQGVVSQEQVLTIARRLYGSSEPYNDIFRQVQQYPGKTNSAGGWSPPSAGGLSPEDQRKLAELMAQRDAQQRQAAAQQLASITATMAQAQGKTYEEISKILHYNLTDLAKELGMSNDELDTYLKGLAEANNAVPDSITTNIDRLIEALTNLLDPDGANRIVTQLRDDNHRVYQRLGEMRDETRRGNNVTQEMVNNGYRSTRPVPTGPRR